MLTITTDAADVIRDLVSDAGGGLRISTGEQSMNGSGPALHVELVESPGFEDEVVSAQGAQVYVDPIAADALDNKVLDAGVEDGEVQFELRERP